MRLPVARVSLLPWVNCDWKNCRPTTIVAANSLTLRPGQEQFVAPAVVRDRRRLHQPDHLVAARRARRRQGRRLHPRQLRPGCRRRRSSAAASGASTSPPTRRAPASARSPCSRSPTRPASAASTSSPRIWEPGDEGPEEFFLNIGFEVIGETQYGEKIGALTICDRSARLGTGADFVTRVLDVVDAIPPGRVMTYGDVAAALGSRAARAVGQVMAHYGRDVPWWRVVRASGASTAVDHRAARARALPGRGHPTALAGRR